MTNNVDARFFARARKKNLKMRSREFITEKVERVLFYYDHIFFRYCYLRRLFIRCAVAYFLRLSSVINFSTRMFGNA